MTPHQVFSYQHQAYKFQYQKDINCHNQIKNMLHFHPNKGIA